MPHSTQLNEPTNIQHIGIFSQRLSSHNPYDWITMHTFNHAIQSIIIMHTILSFIY